MRFHLGPVPADEAFDPEGEGWTSLREPNPWQMQAMAIPLGLLMCGPALAALLFLTPVDLDSWLGWEEPSRLHVHLAALLAGLILLIPAHEMVHALLHPGFGAGRGTIVGVWPARLLFYAHWEGPVTKERLQAILIGPLVVWTVGPILLAAILGLSWPAIGLLALLNALVSCGDMLGFLLVAWQVPRGAVMRNKGYWTWWRLPG
jgi:hypothetical protein